MRDFFASLFKKFRIKSKSADLFTKQKEIRNKSLDEVEVALQRTFINRRTALGIWRIYGGSTKNIDQNRYVIYEFTHNEIEVPTLSLELTIKFYPQGSSLTWSFKRLNSDSQNVSIEALTDKVIEEANIKIEELIASAN